MSSKPVIDQAHSQPVFQCPACRAKQPLQNKCRRCDADLQLLATAKRRVAWLTKHREAAIAAGDWQRAQDDERELRLLQPRGHDTDR